LYGFTNSNPSHREIWSVLIQRELTYFRSIFLSSDLGIRKPEPRAFSLIASITERPTSSFLFFDDTAENVIGAKEAGMQALLVRSLDDVRDALGKLGVDIT
jgi:putative hydrolase of the HAD superfamily